MVKTTSSTKKRQSFVRLGLLLGILILLNIIGNLAYTRFDLTREGRFTLSESTKNLLGSLEDVVYVKVYLEGDFPPGFQKLQQGIRDQLTEMRRYAGGNLEFEFINPADAGDEDPGVFVVDIVGLALVAAPVRRSWKARAGFDALRGLTAANRRKICCTMSVCMSRYKMPCSISLDKAADSVKLKSRCWNNSTGSISSTPCGVRRRKLTRKRNCNSRT